MHHRNKDCHTQINLTYRRWMPCPHCCRPQLVDLTAQLISSGKKAARCSLAVAHPTLPHLLAVATGAGLALLEFVQQGAPPALLTKVQALSAPPLNCVQRHGFP